MKRLFCGWAILQALVVGLGRAFHTQKRDSEKRLKKYGHVFFFIQTELNQWQYALWDFSGSVQYMVPFASSLYSPWKDAELT